MADKIYRYWATVPSGLEEVALDDLRERLPQLQKVNVEAGGRFGQLFFTFRRSPQHLAGFRSCMHLAGLICEMHRATVGQPGLEYICGRIARLDLGPVRSLARAMQPSIDTSSFSLSATLQGRYRYSTSDLVRSVAEILRKKHGLREGQGGAVLKLHLQLTGRRALLGLRLGTSILASRVIVYCLGRLLGMKRGAITLWARREPDELRELYESFDPALLIGLLTGAKRERSGLPPHALVAARDFVPLADSSVEYTLTYSSGDPAGELAELARILLPGGVAVVQVARPEPFIEILREEDYPFEILAGLRLGEHGRTFRLLILERLEEFDPQLLQVAWDI